MRTINKIILHCSASMAGVNLSANDIKAYHCNPVKMGGRGWRNPGYHYVIRLDGTREVLLPEEFIANGVKGHNADSVHVCYVGGLMQREKGKGNSEKSGQPQVVAANTMTPAQHCAITELLHELHNRYPAATFHGHNEFAAKACPGFRVSEVFPEFTTPTAVTHE